MPFPLRILPCFTAIVLLPAVTCSAPRLDERPAAPGEWGFRPKEGEPCRVNPPGFCWRPQKGAEAYELHASRTPDFVRVDYAASNISFNVHCPPCTLADGKWYWRFRYADAKGKPSNWSRVRPFIVTGDAGALPLPTREDLMRRVPRQHPRLFTRPERLPALRRSVTAERRGDFERLLAACERRVKTPPSMSEPPLYPKGMVRKSDEWRKMWWGNRERTIRLLGGAAELAFAHRLGGPKAYGETARRWLMAAAKWDPGGSTGYRYNDEAGMPYAYHFARAYTFANDLLTEDEKRTCREVMRVRGNEMYQHLCPQHLWRPYSSHSSRAWHFLGEVAIAFLDEIPEAREWLWFAANVCVCCYPVWCDDDGGWHEGMAYWSSYIGRFTWWADVLRAAVDIDVYDRPYFSKIGYYPLYMQPPGTKGGGFGDLTARRESRHNRDLMYVFAAQAGNPHWQWYAERHGGQKAPDGFVGFLRNVRPRVEAKPPVDLSSARWFKGTGQVVLNTCLTNARNNVELIFKSSPFGGYSHGYEAQNAFLLYAFGERLLIRTGRRDCYGSDHHRDWMWETKSVNSITVNGQGQEKHSHAAHGRISAFRTGEHIDFVSGEASAAYGGRLERFTRSVAFAKPNVILIHDRLVAPQESSYECRLHSVTEPEIREDREIWITNKGASCRVTFLEPSQLTLAVTDQYSVPPRPRVKLREWHVTATPRHKSADVVFAALIEVFRTGQKPSTIALDKRGDWTYAALELSGGSHAVLSFDRDDVSAVVRDSSERVQDEYGFEWRLNK